MDTNLLFYFMHFQVQETKSQVSDQVRLEFAMYTEQLVDCQLTCAFWMVEIGGCP